MMNYCFRCGAQIFDDAAVCPRCGATQQMQMQQMQMQQMKAAVADRGGFGWSILGFDFPFLSVLIPIVGVFFLISGFIMCLIWRDTKPNTSKDLFWGIIAGIIIVVLIIVGLWLAL